MPAFGGGTSLFQPVYVGDVALLIETIARQEHDVANHVDGKIIEAGGPDGRSINVLRIFTLMARTLQSLPTAKSWNLFLNTPEDTVLYCLCRSLLVNCRRWCWRSCHPVFSLLPRTRYVPRISMSPTSEDELLSTGRAA